MNLIIIAALAAVTSAAKLDRAYLPPASAKTAGGAPGSLQPPLVNSINDDVSRGLGGLPKGSYENEYQGVIVDAAAPGTRTSEEETGLGAPRISYGSMNSKVGVAAFTKQTPFKSAFGDLIDRPHNHKPQRRPGQRYDVRTGQGIHRGASDLLMVNAGSDDSFNHGLGGKVDQGFDESTFSGSSESFDSRIDSGERFNQGTGAGFRGGNKVFNQGIGLIANEPQRPMRARADIDRAANTVRFENNVGSESHSYAFETDNGISAEESGVAVNGVQAQGGYSYTGDDGQVYTVTYTADERGFRPKGAHLPTPPPIPEAILRSLEQNARDEAAGLIDDGSYDAQKYNEGSDYTESVDSNGKYNHQSSKFGNTGETDATASGTFINQNNQAFPRPNKQGINNVPGSNLKQPVLVDPTGQNVNAETPFVSGFNQEASIIQKQGQNRPEYLPPKSGFGPNRVQGSRPGSVVLNANKQQVDQSYTDIQNNTSETDAQINFLARPQDSSFNRPNSNGRQPIRGNGNSAISLQLGNSLRPSTNRENSMRPAIQLGFGKRKEYLPPKNTVNQNGRPAVSLNLKPQIPTGGFSSQSTQEYTDIQPTLTAKEPQSTFSTGPASTSNTFNSFGQQSNVPNKRPMSSFNTGGQFSSTSTQNQFLSASSSLPSQAATSPPATELTTPLENSGPQYHASLNAQQSSFISSSLPDVKPTQSQFDFNTGAQSSASSSFGSKPTSQKPSSSFSIGQNQFTDTQFGSKQPFETSDTQFSPSTLRPSITQQPQGPDSSYYYNQPSKPFQTSQDSRIPSSQSSQFVKEIQTSTFQNQFSTQNGFESTRNPQTSSLASVKPTSSSQSQSNGFSGITQASISPFPSETPTQSTQFPQQSQFSSRPSSSRPMQTQFGTSFGQSSTSQQTFESRPSQTQFGTNFGQSSTSQQSLKPRPTQSQFGSTFEPSSIQQSFESEPSQPHFSTSFGQSPSSQQTFGSSSTQTEFGTSSGQSSTAQQSFGSQSSIRPQRPTNGRQPVPQGQFGQFNKDQSDEEVTETVPTQQYDGEIYEYKKPAQTLPAPNHEDQEEILQDSEVFGQKMPSSSNKPASQFSQSSSSSNNKTPSIQQDSEKSTTSQVNQVQEGSTQFTRPEFNHQENTFLGQKKYNTFLAQKQQNPQQFNNQPRPFGSSNQREQIEQMKTRFGSNNDRLISNSCCQTSKAPVQGSQLSQTQNQFSSSFSSSQGFKPDSTTSSFAGKGEEFGGPRKPPSFDSETGYHY